MAKPKPIESSFERQFIKKLKDFFPGMIVKKLHDAQGIPDRLFLYGSKWAVLEFKRSKDEPHQPNQDWYVEAMDKMSFARFIFPENKKDVWKDIVDFFSDQKGQPQ